MKKLKFTYEMDLEFTAPISSHYFNLRCKPQSNGSQQLCGYNMTLAGYDELGLYTDCFGNEYFSGRCMEQQKKFSLQSSGLVWTGLGANKCSNKPIYKYSTSYTACEAGLTAFFKANFVIGNESLSQATAFQQALYNLFSYSKGATNINTTAEMAFAKRQGVCQDYTHIMLALCRKAAIPAKYIAGLMIGEGETHAWLEIYADGRWVGLDPTHNCLVDDNYIKLAEGRDYWDCLINRGIFKGSASQLQKIYANVEEMK